MNLLKNIVELIYEIVEPVEYGIIHGLLQVLERE